MSLSPATISTHDACPLCLQYFFACQNPLLRLQSSGTVNIFPYQEMLTLSVMGYDACDRSMPMLSVDVTFTAVCINDGARRRFSSNQEIG
jgi:hypothetical protein